MQINMLEQSYINISGKIYDSEFINLANVKNNKIELDKRTLFLTRKEKEALNSQQIKNFNNAIYIFKYKNIYGVVCDIPIDEYDSGRIKCHELVLPDTIQGMLSNLHGYNCEVAPVLLAHEKKVNYLSYIEEKKYIDYFMLEDIQIYVFCGKEAQKISEEFLEVEKLYVADGHHRLYTTSLSSFKNSVLSCLISFEYLDILPIHRIIPNIDAQLFDKAREFIYNRFDIFPSKTSLSKGKIRINYNGDSFVVNLIDLNSDAFWNNDIYRLNTQIISQAFRIFDTGKLKYISDSELEKYELSSDKKDVLIQTYPLEKEEFVECANNNCIMPPKSTWFKPKFPSFLIFKKY
ncbi:DUF1015 family protein [Clostridium aestuarii]|uniref:DUF1015 family protein n=1 Tax=Clostridium aestuarii TaxID=338193 RepID=A0ABT4CZH3_9CLOT|nr:DUF1015 family protein [Clostridium aestuarii]MCY6484386.1 DUF1015 family protein [Clostridium aestuarii]